MKSVLAVIGLILLLVGSICLEAWFVTWVLGLFKISITMLQGFGIVAGLYFVGGFFKAKSNKN